MKIIPLASGSDANSTAVVDDGIVIIVDAGIKRLDIMSRLVGLGILNADKQEPDALLITHEHGDHARFSHQWREKSAVVVATAGTFGALKGKPGAGDITSIMWMSVEVENSLCTPAPVPHDAAEPCCWRIAGATGVAVVATDLGHIPASLLPVFDGATDLLLEANHHPRLLAASKYIPHLRDRVGGDSGHLSTVQACEFLSTMPASIKRVHLGHISKITNDRKLVQALAYEAMIDRDGCTLELA